MGPEENVWHKQVVMTSNNRVWAPSVKDRSAAEDQEMLIAAQTFERVPVPRS